MKPKQLAQALLRFCEEFPEAESADVVLISRDNPDVVSGDFQLCSHGHINGSTVLNREDIPGGRPLLLM